jgi:hypothetical protein
MTAPNARAANALRRIAPAATLLGRTCTVVAAVGALAAGSILAVAATQGLATRWPVGTSAFVVATVLLGAAPLWLWHAGATLRDLAQVPDRLDSRPEFSVARRGGLRDLRAGGIRATARAVRTTVGEYGDYVAPGFAVVEVAAPTFWVWTFFAACAVVITVVLVPVVGLVALLG